MESPIRAPSLMNLLNVLRSAIKRLVNLPIYLFAAPCVINNNGHSCKILYLNGLIFDAHTRIEGFPIILYCWSERLFIGLGKEQLIAIPC